MSNGSPEMVNTIKANTDAFMELSKILISSVEQLTTLNLNTTRDALDQSSAVAKSIFESNGGVPSAKSKKATPLAVSDLATAYFQSVQGIFTEAQQDVTKLMSTCLASQGNGCGQQFSAFVEANRKAMTDVTARVISQSKVYSPKPA